LGVVSDLKFGASTDFSVSYWVRQPASSVYTNLPFFGDAIGSTSLGNAGFALAPYQQDAVPTGGGWMVGMSDGTHAMTSPSQFTTFNDINTINDGNWHHLVHVFSRASSVATYLDGTQVDSEAISFIVNINNNNAATIGQDPTGAYRVPDGTQADLDDLGVWTRALTSLEVSGAYLAGSSNHVSFAAAGLAPVTISTQLAVGNTSLSYTGGAGSQFVLLGTTVVTTPAASWTRIATNSSTPGSFTIPPIGTGTAQYYRVKSE